MRIVNLNEDSVRLAKDQILGGLHPVQVELSETHEGNAGPVSVASPSESLLADLPEEVPPDIRERLGKMLVELWGCFLCY